MSTASSDDLRAADLRQFILQDGDTQVSLLNLGCITRDWQVPLDGAPVPVVLGYDDPASYLHNPFFLGIVAGPVANRISGANFTIGERRYQIDANEGSNLLHGGRRGLGRQIWQAEPDGGRRIRFRLHSGHLEDGFPGNVNFQVMITLAGDRLTYDMRANTDRPTVVNMAQHNYYSLGCRSGVRDARLFIDAAQFTPVDADRLPTGNVLKLAGHHHDFATPKVLSRADPAGQGIDLNYVLSPDRAAPAATLEAANGMALSLWTDQPGLQLYTAAHLRPTAPPLSGQTHDPFAALCLEPQGFPDAPNIPAFPSIGIDPDRPYRQVTTIQIRPRSLR